MHQYKGNNLLTDNLILHSKKILNISKMKINFTTKRSVYLSFGAVILLILLIVSFTLSQSSTLTKNIKNIVNNQNVKSRLIDDMIIYAKNRTIILQSMAITNDPLIRNNLYQSLLEHDGIFISARKKFTALPMSDEEKALIKKHREYSQIITNKQNQAAQLLVEFKDQKARNIIAKAITAQKKSVNILKEINHYQHEIILSTKQKSIDQLHSTNIIGLLLTVIIIFIIISIAGFVYRNIRASVVALKHSYKEILYKELRERTIRDVLLDSVIVINEKGIIKDFNKAAEKAFAYSYDEVIDKNIKMLMPSPDQEQHDSYLENYKQSGKAKIIGLGRETIAKRKDGTTFHVELAVSKFEFKGDTFFVGTLHDISERKASEIQLQNAHDELEKRVAQRTEELAQANIKLSRQANYDALTGLANRYLFYEQLKHHIALSKRNNYKLAILFIDLDGFKYINDTFGHNAGDKLLQEIAKCLTDCLREVDTVARLGGDEFAIILNAVFDVKFIPHVTEKIINAINQCVDINNTLCSVGASIGISIYPDDETSPEELMKQADTAMYQSKNKGKNTFTLFS